MSKSICEMTKTEVEQELIEAGAELARKDNRFGETKSGWWQDQVWLAPKNRPHDALRIMRGN